MIRWALLAVLVTVGVLSAINLAFSNLKDDIAVHDLKDEGVGR